MSQCYDCQHDDLSHSVWNAWSEGSCSGWCQCRRFVSQEEGEERSSKIRLAAEAAHLADLNRLLEPDPVITQPSPAPFQGLPEGATLIGTISLYYYYVDSEGEPKMYVDKPGFDVIPALVQVGMVGIAKNYIINGDD